MAGPLAEALFAIDLLRASVLGGAVLPLATAYAISEALGPPKGVNLDCRRAPVFFALVTALISLGAGVALWPNVPIIPLLLWVQVLNGMLLPLILVFILRLSNDPRLTGDLQHTRVSNLLGWGTVMVEAVAVVVMRGGQLLDRLGLDLFHTESLPRNHSALDQGRADPAHRHLWQDHTSGREASKQRSLSSTLPTPYLRSCAERRRLQMKGVSVPLSF